jgi:hypothetical protein
MAEQQACCCTKPVLLIMKKTFTKYILSTLFVAIVALQQLAFAQTEPTPPPIPVPPVPAPTPPAPVPVPAPVVPAPADTPKPILPPKPGNPNVDQSKANVNGFDYNLINSSRSILLAPSSLCQPGRTGHYNNFMGLLNRLEIGFTDWISLNVGALVSPLAFPFYLNLKSTHEIYPMLRVGGMLTYTSQFTEASYFTSTKHNGYSVTPTLIAGYGGQDYNFSVSTSYIIGDGNIIPMVRLWDFNTTNNGKTINYGSTWIGTMAVHARATNALSVVAEYSQSVIGYAVMGGLRIDNRKQNSTWDLGLFGSSLQNYPLPYVSYSYSF